LGCLFGSYLFSFFYYWKLLTLKTEWVKHLYMVSVANLFMFACFTKWQILQVYAPITFTFLLTRAFRKEWWMPVVNFIAIMLLLSGAHLYRQFGPDADFHTYKLDITGPLMMLTMKLTSFAFDMYDSRKWFTRRQRPIVPNPPTPHEVVKAPPSEKSSKCPVVEPATKFSVIRKYPSAIEFLGYSLLFPGLLTGPTVPFYEYRTFINGTYFAGVDVTKDALPGRKRRALYLFTVACCSLAIYVLFLAQFSPEHALGDEFTYLPWWRRSFFLHMSNFVTRSKYYFAWMIAEGSYVIIGLGFRLSAAQKPLWDRFENINPIRIETVTDFRLLVSQWNVCTNLWLNAYVYRRLQNYFGKGSSSSRASLCTYVISAIWHGFYPGYYLMFVSSAWLTIVSRSIPLIVPFFTF
jgi:lysophospholipid acyltransferase